MPVGKAHHIEGDVNFGAQHGGGQINLLDVYQYSRAEPNLMKGGMVFSQSLRNWCQLSGGKTSMLRRTYYLVVGTT